MTEQLQHFRLLRVVRPRGDSSDEAPAMRRRPAGALAMLLIAAGVVLVPGPAEAVNRVWTFQNVSGAAQPIQQGGTPATLSVNCPSGQTPVAGWVIPSQGDDLRRRSETLGLGSGAGYSVQLEDQSPGSAVITVTPHVRCVSMANFTPGTVLTTPAQVFQVNDSTQLAEGEATCPANYQVISGSVTFVGTGGVTLLTTAPSAGPGWEARGWHESDFATMSVRANCVLTSDLPGARIHGNLDPVGFGSSASRNCPSGTALISGGTYHAGGDGQAVTINQRLVTSGSTTGWASTTIGDPAGGGALQTRVLCMPSASPSVQVSGSSGYTNMSSASWSFTATDPAAGGGYTMSTTCSLTHPNGNESSAPCTSPVSRSGLVDGLHSLSVVATTSDGRTATNEGSVIVDTVAPGVTFDDAQDTIFPTASPTIAFTPTDATAPVTDLACWVDDEPVQPCDVPVARDYRRPQSLGLSGLAQGPHTLHVRATDAATNAGEHTLDFTIDTQAPTVSMTRPNAAFQLALSTTAVWSGQDDGGTGIADYSVHFRTAPYNGDFETPSQPTTLGPSDTSKTYTGLVTGSTYCYSVTARDKAGHQSAQSTKCTAIPLDDRSLTRSSGWTTSTPRGWFKGTAVSTKKRGATLSKDASLKRVAIVAQRCPTCGVVGIFVDRTLVGRVNLAAARSSRVLINLPAFSLRTGTVTIKVLSSGKLVKIDALGVSRS